MIRSINRRVLNEETEGWNIRVKTFGGAKVEDMDYYLEPTLQYKPKAIILHCGTDNLRRDSLEVVANKVISLAVKVKRRVANVAVSGIIMRTDSNELEQKRREANELIKRGLHQHHVDFIDHENINSYHLDNSGLHLKQFGTNILSGNFQGRSWPKMVGHALRRRHKAGSSLRRRRKERGGPGAEPPEKFFRPRPFLTWKRPFLYKRGQHPSLCK